MTIPPITKAEDLVERVKISFMTDAMAPAEEKPEKSNIDIVVANHFPQSGWTDATH